MDNKFITKNRDLSKLVQEKKVVMWGIICLVVAILFLGTSIRVTVNFTFGPDPVKANYAHSTENDIEFGLSITSISPSSVSPGSSGQNFNIDGTGFAENLVVRINSNPDSAGDYLYFDENRAQVYVPTESLAQEGEIFVMLKNPLTGSSSNTVVISIVTPDNPVPTISRILPEFILVGQGNSLEVTGAQAIYLTGTGFVDSSVVQFNGLEIPTSLISGIGNSYLQARIPASNIETAGTFNVQVKNTAPGGGISNKATFTVENPEPTITDINPLSTVAGSAVPITITITGTGFISGVSTVNQTDLLGMTYVIDSPTQITVTLPVSTLTSPTSGTLTVKNSGPGGGLSDLESFNILSANPVPHIDRITPSSIGKGGPYLILTIYGSNFINNSIVKLDGTNQLIDGQVFFSNIKLIIPSNVLETEGTHTITVFNPAPRGGTSNEVTFTVTNINAQVGTITINKEVTGGNDTFNFNIINPTTNNIQEITTSNGTGSSGPIKVYSGTYTILEYPLPDGYYFVSGSCSSGVLDSNSTSIARMVNINVSANQVVTCNFNNSFNNTASSSP